MDSHDDANRPDNQIQCLFTAASSGDMTAAGEVLARVRPIAIRAALVVLQSPHDAADATAAAEERVLRALLTGRIDSAAGVRSYFCTAARRAALDEVRRRARQRRSEGDLVEPASPGADHDTLERDDRRRAAAALRKLPPRWQLVLQLHTIDGLSPGEIAGLLGITPNAAAQLAFRARKALRREFEDNR